MADIIPFKGIRYNKEKIIDLSKVIAPPYDVISPEEKAKLRDSEEHNIIRILLGDDLPGDNGKENKYSRAAGFLNDWIKKDILKKEDEESIYIYLQEFEVEGELKKRLGFLALLKLEEFDTETSTIYPHEYTLDAPKKDRTSLISSIEANLGPIFAVFGDDEDRTIEHILRNEASRDPLIDVVDFHGIRNKLWRVTNKNTVGKIVSLIKEKELFIADGHHRYEVGLEFSKIKKDKKYGYILTYFTDLYADGIVVLPVHRLIKGVDKDSMQAFKKELKNRFVVEDIAKKEDVKGFLSKAMPKEKRFVLYDSQGFLGIIIKDNDSLDVTVLHSIVIDILDKIIVKNKGKFSIDFTKDLSYAINEVDKGDFSLSIIMNPTKITEIRDMALSGKRMPQKSTYFYPKVVTGLVINIFDKEK
ncbi:MAG: DUF1015 domain-containing protein [Candidatus Omnitrophota bacterium]